MTSAEQVAALAEFFRAHAIKPHADGNYYFDGRGNPISPPETADEQLRGSIVKLGARVRCIEAQLDAEVPQVHERLGWLEGVIQQTEALRQLWTRLQAEDHSEELER